MGLKAGIVGLPNVGKSTLFNAITNAQVEAANYPFATIEPNTGVVAVPDSRLDFLSSHFKPTKKIPATVEFVDIAGLVRGASKGEGLGNQFLAAIREADAIVQVVRCFENSDIIHVENSVDPKRDIEIINLELVFADLDSLTRKADKVASKAKGQDKQAIQDLELIQRVRAYLVEGKPVRLMELTLDQQSYLRETFQLLTLKPLLYLANVGENEYAEFQKNKHYQTVEAIALQERAQVVAVSCEIESQISKLPDADKPMFLESIGATESGLNRLIKKTYALLGLATYFTVGSDECKAWTFKLGMKAPQCAGVIHSDFEKGFIKAEIYHYDDFVKYRSELAIKEAGKLRMEGKEYVVKDGDIIFYRFNV